MSSQPDIVAPLPRPSRASGDGESRELVSGPVALSCARRVGRYLLLNEVARGGMATVHLGRVVGDQGFYRRVAIKRLLPQFTRDPQFARMMLDEARIAASVSHPNVASVIDVVREDDELFLILEYIHGDTLARLIRRSPGTALPLRIVASVVSGLLHGLHAAHVARDEYDEPLELVHRDISPQNVMVGVDGLARVLDFGIAKALGSGNSTSKGDIKGKLAYMAPEQLNAEPATQQSDIYAAGVVLWEALTGRRLFDYASEREAFARPSDFVPEGPSKLVEGLPEALDAVVLRALSPVQSLRFSSAREMALALEAVTELARPSEVGAWVEELLQHKPVRSSQRPPSGKVEVARVEVPKTIEISASAIEPSDEPHPTRIQRGGTPRKTSRPPPAPVLHQSPRPWVIVLISVLVTALGYVVTQGVLSHWAKRAAHMFDSAEKR